MTLQAVEDVLHQGNQGTVEDLRLQDPESVGGNRVKQVVKLRKGLSRRSKAEQDRAR